MGAESIHSRTGGNEGIYNFTINGRVMMMRMVNMQNLQFSMCSKPITRRETGCFRHGRGNSLNA